MWKQTLSVSIEFVKGSFLLMFWLLSSRNIDRLIEILFPQVVQIAICTE